MAESNSNQQTATQKAQDFMQNGASYAQEATVGLKKSTGEQTKAPEEVPKTSDPALEAKVDKASPGKVEDFLRSQTRSEPPEDVMKGENK